MTLSPTVRLIFCWVLIAGGFLAVAVNVWPWLFLLALVGADFLRYRIRPHFSPRNRRRRTVVFVGAVAMMFALHALSGFAEDWPIWLDIPGVFLFVSVAGWFFFDDLRMHNDLVRPMA